MNNRVLLFLGLTCLPITMGSVSAKQAPTAAQAKIAPGRVVFDRWCSSCHGSGKEYPGTGALMAKYKGELPGELLQRKDLTPDVVKAFVRNGVSVMPFFRKTEISDAELDALATYLSRKKK